MIRLTIGTNTERKTVLVEPTETLSNILRNNEVNTAGAALHLNGSLIPGAALDDTLEELDILDNTSVSLIAVVKADSAF